MSSESEITWVADECAKAFAASFAAMTGETLTATVNPQEPDAAVEPEPFRWQQLFSAGAESLLWLEAPKSCWTAVASGVLRAAGIDDSDETSQHSTFLEVVQQALSGVASAIGQRLKRDVSCSNGALSSAPPQNEKNRIQFTIDAGLMGAHSITLTVSGALAAVLSAGPAARETSPPQLSASLAPARPDSQPSTPRTMGLLMEVELPIGVSFGRAQMRLKDVIRLTTGCIVELNRSVSEPVEIIVNNCVIARGQVVVVEGNYGVRIQQIVSREERLRTLY